MESFDLFHNTIWRPFAPFGITHNFFALNADTIIFTWVALGIILIFSLVSRYALSRKNTFSRTLLLIGLGSMRNLHYQSLQKFVYRYYIFISSLFIFILVCNCLILIPGLEEPTKDLNTTLGLALIAFFYVQKESLMRHGLIRYLGDFFKTPFTLQWPTSLVTSILFCLKIILNVAAALFSFPLELLSRGATIISLSFRLFGNIFGGSIISSLWQSLLKTSVIWQLIGIITGINLIIVLFFGLFEGLIQAFVFATLTLTYLSLALNTTQGQNV